MAEQENKVSSEDTPGWGDQLEKAFNKTGVTRAVNKITKGKDCGCKKRKKQVNNAEKKIKRFLSNKSK